MFGRQLTAEDSNILCAHNTFISITFFHRFFFVDCDLFSAFMLLVPNNDESFKFDTTRKGIQDEAAVA